ncbi:MAG TPA: hypothetical protein VH986_12500 [Acidimicrobiia bacterium]
MEPTREPGSRSQNLANLGWWVRLLDPTRYLREVERVRARLPRVHRDERAESFAGAAIAILLAIGLQYFLPHRVTQYQRWVFPTVAGVLLLALVIGHRERLDRPSPVLRGLTLLTIAVMSVANGVAGLRLVRDLIEGEGIKKPGTLLFAGAAIWLTNVIVFALVFWMFDRGGPVSRFLVQSTPPDLLFPQHEMTSGAEGWRPYFFDYFYTSFTNATAFSPTDVMPLARWAKFAMLLESSLSLVLAILVVARAVNILD